MSECWLAVVQTTMYSTGKIFVSSCVITCTGPNGQKKKKKKTIFTTLWINSAADKLTILFSYLFIFFFQKIGFVLSFKLSPKKTICMKGRYLFSGKEIETYFKMSSAETLPSMLTLVLLYPDIHCLCKQCRSRLNGFWRSHLIWICMVCHSIYGIMSTIWIKEADWLTIRCECGILIDSTWQG